MQRLEATVATLRSQCRQLQLASGQPTAALRPRVGRPVTPSRGRRKSVEQWSSPSIAPSEAPHAAAAAAAEPGGATATASAALEAAAEGRAEGAGRPLVAPASSTSTSTSTSNSTSTSTSNSNSTSTPTTSPSTSASTVRELELRLERATATTAGLALLWGAQRYPQIEAMPGAGGPQQAEAWSRAVPGAVDALQALQGALQGKRVLLPAVQAERDALALSYLRLLWHARPPAAPAAGAAGAAGAAAAAGVAGRGGEAAGSAAAWERRLLRHLSSSASHSQGGACFGAGSHGALRPTLTLPILYLLWP